MDKLIEYATCNQQLPFKYHPLTKSHLEYSRYSKISKQLIPIILLYQNRNNKREKWIYVK